MDYDRWRDEERRRLEAQADRQRGALASALGWRPREVPKETPEPPVVETPTSASGTDEVAF